MSLPLTDDLGVVQTVDNGTPVYWNNGLGYDASGMLCVTTAVETSDIFIGGKRRSLNGSLVVADASTGGATLFLQRWLAQRQEHRRDHPPDGRPSLHRPRVAGIAIGPLGGVYMLSGGGGFSPLDLFANGEPGFWYDPSDLTTMFQDSGGTVPMAPVGTVADQPVGLILDKSGNDNFATAVNAAARPLLSARKNLLVGTATLATQTVSVLNEAHIISFSGAGSVVTSGAYTGMLANGETFVPAAGSLTLTITGAVNTAQLEAGIKATEYQRVTSPSDYDAVGFPHYLKFDGVNNALNTSAVNLTGVAASSAWYGLKKNGVVSVQIVSEFSSTWDSNPGTFVAYALDADEFRVGSSGNVPNIFAQGPASFAPVCITATANIPAPFVRQSQNSAPVAENLSSQGPGTYGNYPLYIGARASNSLYLQGLIYEFIVAGANYDAATVAKTEDWVASKMDILIPYTAPYGYVTPVTASPPVSGQIVHGDNTPSKLNVSKTDANGILHSLESLTAGAIIGINGTSYAVQGVPIDGGTYVSVTVTPQTQQPDGTYNVTLTLP